VRGATDFSMSFDPAMRFEDVQMQLYGFDPHSRQPMPPLNPAANERPLFASAETAANAAGVANDRQRVMEYFPFGRAWSSFDIAHQFAVFNFWHSSFAGAEHGQNRFSLFTPALSGGLTDSPDTATIVGGFLRKMEPYTKDSKQRGLDWLILS